MPSPPIALNPSHTALDMLAHAAAQRTVAPRVVELSPAFKHAGARCIVGDWPEQQSKALLKEQQAMLESMFAHMGSMLTDEVVTQNSDRIGFRFRHTYESGSEPAHAMAIRFVVDNASYLDGELTVNRDGEVTGISIRDPAIGDLPEKMVKLKKPVPLCHEPSSDRRVRKRLEQSPRSPSGSPSKRLALSQETPDLLSTHYVNITPSDDVQSLLGNKIDDGNKIDEPLPLDFYYKLRTLKGGTGKSRRDGILKVLEPFGNFLAKNELSLRDIMGNSREFLKHARRYQKTCREHGAKGEGKLAQNARGILQHICKLSFGDSPLTQYVERRIQNSDSPLHELCTDGKRSFLRVHVYCIDSYAVRVGKESAGALFANPKDAIKAGEEIVREYPSNKNLHHFILLLRRDLCPVKLDSVFSDALAESEKAQQQDEKAGRKRKESTTNVYANIAYRIAGYAYLNGQSEEILQRLKSFPWEARDKSGKDARRAAMEQFRPILDWTGANSGQLGSTVSALAQGLALMPNPSIPQPDTAAEARTH